MGGDSSCENESKRKNIFVRGPVSEKIEFENSVKYRLDMDKQLAGDYLLLRAKISQKRKTKFFRLRHYFQEN